MIDHLRDETWPPSATAFLKATLQACWIVSLWFVVFAVLVGLLYIPTMLIVAGLQWVFG